MELTGKRPAAEGTRLKTWMKVAALTFVLAVPAMLLGRVIWPPAPDGPVPSDGQLPFFIFLAAAEALTFGLGVAFLVFGLPFIRRASAGNPLRAWAIYLSIGWLLVSWWPHDNLHIHNGENLQGLLYIEYGFHITLMTAGLVMALCFISLLKDRVEGSPASAEHTR